MPTNSILANAPELRGKVEINAQDLRVLLDHADTTLDPAIEQRLRQPLERRAARQAERAAAAERERDVLRAAGYVQHERDLWSWNDGDYRISGMRRTLFEHHLRAQQCTHAPAEKVCDSCYLPRDRRAVA
jgi:hypothetical protein